jgi:hypothetical protein
MPYSPAFCVNAGARNICARARRGHGAIGGIGWAGVQRSQGTRERSTAVNGARRTNPRPLANLRTSSSHPSPLHGRRCTAARVQVRGGVCGPRPGPRLRPSQRRDAQRAPGGWWQGRVRERRSPARACSTVPRPSHSGSSDRRTLRVWRTRRISSGGSSGSSRRRSGARKRWGALAALPRPPPLPLYACLLAPDPRHRPDRQLLWRQQQACERQQHAPVLQQFEASEVGELPPRLRALYEDNKARARAAARTACAQAPDPPGGRQTPHLHDPLQTERWGGTHVRAVGGRLPLLRRHNLRQLRPDERLRHHSPTGQSGQTGRINHTYRC